MTGVEPSRPVLVLGGTGHYGWHIVKSLLAKEAPVRVLSRDSHAARKALGKEPSIVQGDITDRSALECALDGARSVVIAVSAFSRSLIHRLWEIEHDAVLQAFEVAVEKGVERVVLISVYAIEDDFIERFDMEAGRVKRAVEKALAATDLNWTVLGAPPSMEIFFATIRGDTMVFPGGGPPAFPTISSVDVGEIAAQAALRDDLAGQRFSMAGPEALSFPEAAARLSKALGKEIRFKKIPLALPRMGGAIAGLFVPYFGHMVTSMVALNNFPQHVAAQVPQAHRRLLETFNYTPTTLEMEAERRRRAAGQVR